MIPTTICLSCGNQMTKWQFNTQRHYFCDGNEGQHRPLKPSFQADPDLLFELIAAVHAAYPHSMGCALETVHDFVQPNLQSGEMSGT